jgi:hypothetical protein
MVRCCERVAWSGDKIDLVMYRWFGVVSQGFVVLFRFGFCGDFRSPLLVNFLECFRDLSLGIWWGMYVWTLHGSFPFDSPPKSMSKGARFWGFRCSRVRGALGGISSINLDLASFGGHKLGYGVSVRCSYYSQSLVQIRRAIREIRSWIWRSWPPGCCSSWRAQVTPVWPVPLTSLTGVDPCWVLLGWTFGWVRCCPVLLLFRVWVVLELGRPVWCYGAFWLGPVWPVCYTELTGVRAVLWKSPGFTSRDRWCSPAWPV